jgi:hypothetical protein
MQRAEDRKMETAQLQLHERGDRVREHTAQVVNDRIDEKTLACVAAHVRQGRDAILRRLEELDHEWDIDRAMFVNFAVIGGAMFATGLAKRERRGFFGSSGKGFLTFFGVQLGFLLLHGLAGWCPPVSLFRRLGFRTTREIEAERRALEKALR